MIWAQKSFICFQSLVEISFKFSEKFHLEGKKVTGWKLLDTQIPVSGSFDPITVSQAVIPYALVAFSIWHLQTKEKGKKRHKSAQKQFQTL